MNFGSTRLVNTSFSDMGMEGADFTQANTGFDENGLIDVDPPVFTNVNLNGSSFVQVALRGVTFQNVSLTSADFGRGPGQA